ncbi:hypothetical protein CHH54_21450 [Bacillus sp. 7520-S]|nr:hypothetical protein CHH54_21450 [Bacillus sp. 7520-S]
MLINVLPSDKGKNHCENFNDHRFTPNIISNLRKFGFISILENASTVVIQRQAIKKISNSNIFYLLFYG